VAVRYRGARRGHAGSDADLFVVLDFCDAPFLEWSLVYQPEFCGIGVDIFANTREDLAGMKAKGHPLLKDIQTDGLCFFNRRGS
jgi:hypothetical protein